MNTRQLIELSRVNLRYVNPQATDKARKKGKQGKELTRSILSQYLFSGIIFILVYGLSMVALDFSQLPGQYTYFLALFGILGFSQGITTIYNVFFESKDLGAYLPLPFRQGEIFLAKILVVTLTLLPFVFPLLMLFVLAGWRAGYFLPLAVLLALFLFGLFLIILFGICSFIVFGLTRTKFFKKHKNLVTNLMLGLTMIVVFIGIFALSFQDVEISATGELMDRTVIVFLLPFFYPMVQPFSALGLASLAIIIGLAGALFLLIKVFFLPKLYDQMTELTSTPSREKRKHKNNQNLSQLLRNYNLQLLKEPNLVMQIITSSLVMPFIFIFSFMINGDWNLSEVDYRFTGVIFLAGVVFSILTTNQTSFVANLISLDRENFLFIKSLPFPLEKYLKAKFLLGFLLQLALTGTAALIGALVMQLPFTFIVALLSGVLLGTYLLSLRYFSRDYKLLELNWTNVSQLFTRGIGSIGLVLTLMGTIFVSGILLVIYGFAAVSTSFLILNLPVLILIIVVSIFIHLYYQKSFWKTLN